LVYPVFTGVDDSFKHVRPVVSSSILLTLLQLCKVLLTTFVNFFYVWRNFHSLFYLWVRLSMIWGLIL